MLLRIKKHIKDNKGEQYLWMLTLAVIILLLFGIIFAMMTITIDLKNLTRDMQRASDSVFADIREFSYLNLMQGKTEYSQSEILTLEVMEKFSEELDADLNNGIITKRSAEDKLAYKISDFRYYYYPDNVLLTDVKKGDVNGDGVVTLADKQMASAYISGEFPKDKNGIAVAHASVDVNNDGFTDDIDVGIINELIKYYAIHEADPSTRDKGVVLLSFELSTPIRLGNMSFGDDERRATYSMSLTFK